MASVRLGFLFSDGSFFNAQVRTTSWENLQSGVHGNWEMQAFAAQLASRHSIILQPAMYLKEVVEGGLLPQKNLKDGHLYMHAVQPTIVSAPQDGVAETAADEMDNSQFVSAPQDMATEEAADDLDNSQLADDANGKWVHSNIMLLLETYRSKKHLLSRATMTTAQVWKMIADEMGTKGCIVTGPKAKKKFDNMRARLKTITDNNAKTGRGRSSWAYYDIMMDLTREDPSIVTPITVSSLGGTKENTTGLSSNRTQAGNSAQTGRRGELLSESGAAKENGAAKESGAAKNPEAEPGAKLRQRDRKNGPPKWFTAFENRSHEMMGELVKATRERNELIQKLIDKL